MKKKKLFLVHNHKNFSGAARSLGETIINLKKKVDFIVICPSGTSSKFFKTLNIQVFEVKLVPRFNHFEIGYYRSLRWLLLLREIIAFIYFFFFLIYLKLKFQNIEKFHLNELELVIIAPMLKIFFDAKITSHLRSPVEMKKGKKRIKLLRFLCKKYLQKIVSIDTDCYKTSPLKKITQTIYNSINLKNISLKKIKNKKITFGFVGSFIERKGIYETLQVFKKINKKLNIRLICLGRNNKSNFLLNLFNYEKNFDSYFNLNLLDKEKNIKILNMKFDLKEFYRNIDIILFPGYMNAVGRPVIEAAILKKPSIIALKKYNNDTAMKGNCLIFKPGDLKSYEKKVVFFVKNKSKINSIGLSAYKNARLIFNIHTNSNKFYKLI